MSQIYKCFLIKFDDSSRFLNSMCRFLHEILDGFEIIIIYKKKFLYDVDKRIHKNLKVIDFVNK